MNRFIKVFQKSSVQSNNFSSGTFDVCLVGAGLAGCILADQLSLKGYSVLVFDQVSKGEASKVSSGLINPVTGLRFVKTWKFEELLETALLYYRDLELRLVNEFINKTEILVFLKEIEAENNWLARAGDPLYSSFIGLEPFEKQLGDQLHLPLSLGRIRHVHKVDIPNVVRSLKKDLRARCNWIEAPFIYSLLETFRDLWKYEDRFIFKKVVFCEGYKLSENPFFNWLPVHNLKGEFLKVKLSSRMPKEILHSDYTVIPLDKQDYWVGSNYELKNTTEKTTNEERLKQEEFIRRTVKSPFDVSEHGFGIRAASRDRRPVVGEHPEHQNLFLINGLGTKGVTLAPYCAVQLLSLWAQGVKLPPEIDIKRKEKKGFYRMNETFDRSK